MKYHVTVGERRFVVEVAGEHVTIDGAAVEAHLVPVAGTPLRRLVQNGQSRSFALLPTEDGWHVELAGRQWDVAVIDERTHQLEELTGAAGAGKAGGLVKAPMPGLVLAVEVAEGQAVTRGLTLLTIESMKLQSALVAPRDGAVAEVLFQEGETFDKDQVLIRLEQEPEALEDA